MNTTHKIMQPASPEQLQLPVSSPGGSQAQIQLNGMGETTRARSLTFQPPTSSLGPFRSRSLSHSVARDSRIIPLKKEARHRSIAFNPRTFLPSMGERVTLLSPRSSSSRKRQTLERHSIARKGPLQKQAYTARTAQTSPDEKLNLRESNHNAEPSASSAKTSNQMDAKAKGLSNSPTSEPFQLPIISGDSKWRAFAHSRGFRPTPHQSNAFPSHLTSRVPKASNAPKDIGRTSPIPPISPPPRATMSSTPSPSPSPSVAEILPYQVSRLAESHLIAGSISPIRMTPLLLIFEKAAGKDNFDLYVQFTRQLLDETIDHDQYSREVMKLMQIGDRAAEKRFHAEVIKALMHERYNIGD